MCIQKLSVAQDVSALEENTAEKDMVLFRLPRQGISYFPCFFAARSEIKGLIQWACVECKDSSGAKVSARNQFLNVV